MESIDYPKLLKNKRQTIGVVVFAFFIITAIFTFSQPLNYESDSSLLVVQKFPENADPYTIVKSNEYLTSLMSSVIISNSFYNNVVKSGFNVDQKYFSEDNNKYEIRKKWQNTISVSSINDTGLIDIKIKHTDKQQLDQIARAVNFTLKSRHQDYHGLGSQVTIKEISKPTFSNWPASPNIILNLLLSVLFGLVVALSYVYLFPEDKYNFRFWPKRKIKNNKPSTNWEGIGSILERRNYTKKETENNNFQVEGSVNNLSGPQH